jgi:hypothetical protein
VTSNRFSRHRQPLACRGCGKLTTGAIDSRGPDLCRKCYERAGLENDHEDNGHNTPMPNCPACEACADTLYSDDDDAGELICPWD